MKALTLKQPWANMIVSGEKTIETRTWYTSWRGWLLICSSREPRIEPAGYGLAIAKLVDCRNMVAADCVAACCELYRAQAWVLSDVTPILPIPMRGQLGLFDVDDRLLACQAAFLKSPAHPELVEWQRRNLA
jgi:hypothetical protein